MKRRLTLTAFLASVVVCATSLGFTPAIAAPNTSINSVPSSSGFAAATPRIPLVDSQLGVGAPLIANIPTNIALGLDVSSPKATSALIRVSLFEPAVNVQLEAVGTPALTVDATESASTTLLVPVIDGAVQLESTGDVDLRVELIASFEQSTAPGSFAALATPVTRADTEIGLGADLINTVPTLVGVTGIGGVPVSHVRAVMVTVTVIVDTPTSMSLAGQEISIAAGTTIVSTVAQANAEGEIAVALEAGSGAARIDVRGYVLGAAQNDSALSVNGSYIPVGDVSSLELDASDKTAIPLELSSLKDADYSLVLLAADAADETTILSIGDELKGRAAGAVVDRSAGAQAQLALVPMNSVVEIRRGSAGVSVQRLGDIVSEIPLASSDLAVTLDSPTAGASIALTEISTFTLEGTVTNSTSSLESVRIYSGTDLIGIAEVDYRLGVSSWSLELAVPETADYTFRVEAVDRTGSTATDEVAVTVTLPGDDEVLLSSDTRIISDSILASMVAISDTTLTFGVDPGLVPGNVVLGINATIAPKGFLRRVVSVQETSAGWVLTTSNASLVDAIRQGDIDDTVDLMNLGGASFTASTAPGDGDTPGLIVEAGDVENVTLFDNSTNQRQANRDPNFTLEDELQKGLEAKSTFTWEPTGVQKDLSNANSSATNAAKAELSASGGAVIEGNVELGFALKFVLKIDIVWLYLPSSEVVEFSTVLTRSTEASLSGSVYGEAELSVDKTIGTINFPTIQFPIGPLYVVITSEAILGIHGELNADASFETTWGTRIIQDYGFRYMDGRFRDASTSPRVTNTLPVFGDGVAWEGNATAAVGPTAELSISIYDAAGPVIEGAGTLGIDFAADTSGMEFEAFLEGTVSVGVELKFPVIDRVLLEATIVAATSRRWTLVTWSSTWDEIFNGNNPDGGETGEEGPGGPSEPGGVSDPNMPRPNPAPEFDASDLRITLYWNNKSDMDLHVVEPDGTEIYYGARGPTASQGQLDIDSNGGCNIDRPDQPGGIENIYWPNGVSAPTGNYSISVDRYSACNLPDAKWIVEVWNGSDLVLKQTGSKEQSFTINVKDIESRRSAIPGDRITVMDSVPLPITVGPKE